MDKLHAIQVFGKVAECGGFAAAARELTLSPPAVTRAVSLLEESLGTRLFVRTTRSVRLTESGERFLRDTQRILQDLAEAEEAAIGSHAAPRGELRITAPALFGRMFVAPILGAYLDAYPLMRANALFIDRIVNLMDEGMDVAIRIGDLPDSSQIAVRVGSVRRVIFAAPAYLEKYGVPKHPRDLTAHRLIQPMAVDASPEWRFMENGAPISVRIDARLRINTNDSVIEMALRGWGLSRLLSYQIAPYIADGRLQSVLTAYEAPPSPVHILHQEGRLTSGKIRSFVDFMAERLRSHMTPD